MKLSVVSTLYGSAPHLEEFHARMSHATRAVAGDDYEIILVNDGSPDDSLELAIQLLGDDNHLRIVDLSRNFGHHHAMISGLEQARGERVFLIDSDLEEDPDWLLKFWETMQDKSCDSVYGVQEQRKGGMVERFSGWIFYILFNFLTGFEFPKNIVTARLMNRAYLDAFLGHRERELSIGGLFFITGFDQCAVTVKKLHLSPSTYTLARKLSVFVNSVVSFSSKPLVGIFVFGMSVFLLSLFVSAYYVINAMILGEPPSGWTSLMVSVWMLGGLIISCIGIVGIYLSKVYNETKARPRAIVRRILERETNQS